MVTQKWLHLQQIIARAAESCRVASRRLKESVGEKYVAIRPRPSPREN